MADLVVQYWWHFDVEWKKIADIAVIPALLEVFSFFQLILGGSLLDWSRLIKSKPRSLDDVVHVSSCFHRVNKASMEGQSDVWTWIVVWSVMGMLAYSGCVTSIDCFWIICCAFVLPTSWWEERGGKCFSNPCLSEHVRTWDSWTWQSIRCISIPCTVSTVIPMCTCALMHVHFLSGHIYIYVILMYMHTCLPLRIAHIFHEGYMNCRIKPLTIDHCTRTPHLHCSTFQCITIQHCDA